MCDFGGTASSLPHDAPADPTVESRDQRLARKRLAAERARDQKLDTDVAPPPPTLSDLAVRDAATANVLLAQRGLGRKSTFLSPDSLGDTTSLLGRG